MATIKKQGRGYKITASRGYDINGKQLREHMTWAPEPGMTARQIEKELNRQAVLFEEQVAQQITHDGNIRLADFTDIFFQDYEANLKTKTDYTYHLIMKSVNQALGHIKLKELKPGHIAAFYANLQEEGMRTREVATPKIDFAKWMKKHRTCVAELSRETGISRWAFNQMKVHKHITKESAVAIAAFMKMDLDKVFTFTRDMRPLKPKTIHTYHQILSSVLSHAVKWGYIRENPASRVDLPSIGGNKAAYLDEPDARHLLELLQDEPILWRTLMTFDLLSGLRRGELAGLRWQDVDIGTQTITICQTYNYVPNKGTYIDTPKTISSNRPLRISRSAVLLLLEYKKWQDAQREKLGDAWEDKDGRVFTSDGGAPVFPDSISKWFSKFIKRSGLPKVTVHSLRHTYASLMISDGVPLVVVSHQLGHAQTSTTANIYAHVIASAEARAAQTFDMFDDIIIPAAEKVAAKIG